MAESDHIPALRALWRDVAEKGIDFGVDYPRIVLTLFSDLDAVRALHVPWYEIDRVRHDFTVVCYGPNNLPADHVCTDSCLDRDDPENTEHQVLACSECRGSNPEDWDDLTCHPFWPCPTIRALDGVRTPPGPPEQPAVEEPPC